MRDKVWIGLGMTFLLLGTSALWTWGCYQPDSWISMWVASVGCVLTLGTFLALFVMFCMSMN